MIEELKSCPKCGPDGAPLRRIGEMDEYRVECVECYTVKTPWFKTTGEAEAYWNAFAEGMTQQAARIAELEKENREQLIDYENRLCEARKYQHDAVKRCEELEQMAEARKLANRLLEQERNELEAERDRMREALEEIASREPSSYETNHGETGCWSMSCDTCDELIGIAQKALKGAGE